MSTLNYITPLTRSSARLERLVLALGLFLPVPLLSATGLSVPLPAVVERLTAALVPWGDAAVLSGEPVERGLRGSIVLTRSEGATPGVDARVVSVRVQRTASAAERGAGKAPAWAQRKASPQASVGEGRLTVARGRSATPAHVAVVPSTPATEQTGATRGTAKRNPAEMPGASPEPRDPLAYEPKAPPVAANDEPKEPEKQTPAGQTSPPPPPPPPPAPTEQPAPTVVKPVVEVVDQTTETTLETVDKTVDPVKKGGENVLVTVDKTADKSVGQGQNVVHDVDVTVEKLPKLPGG